MTHPSVLNSVSGRCIMFQCKFESVASLRSALWHEFGDTIPDEGEFNVGYFEGKQHTKKWLISSQDLDVMYAYFEGKQSINL